jgi:uncharacterized protein YegP (UPF0339 family)
MRIEIVKRYVERGGTYWFVRVRARNGRIIAHSENYPTRRAARRCAELLCLPLLGSVTYIIE